jgi:tetratricopeptide (TPR) repeat protein
MAWLRTEYILKGIFLGLLVFAALEQPDWDSVRTSALVSAGALVLCLAIAAYQKNREGFSPKGRPIAFLLFLLLESPELVYAGVIVGMAAAAFLVSKTKADNWLLAGFALCGAVAGAAFGLPRHVRWRSVRIGVSLVIAVIVVGFALLWFGELGDWGAQLGLTNPMNNPSIFGAQLLIGIPLFYLLAFSGKEEESEVEIGALCAALALGIGTVAAGHRSWQSAGFIAALAIYLWYSARVLPRLRVFKHALRGMSYSQLGRYKPAILSYRRALEHEPHNTLAREGLWAVHRALDPRQLADDPETLKVLDFSMCVERVGSLLLEAKPSEAKLEEAHRLLDMVHRHKPELRPAVHYWRAVAHTHERKYDAAADELREVVDPTGYLPDDANRRSVLLPAWQLALRLHPELARRVGQPQLAIPGRRMEAIAAVERYLVANPNDADAWAFKQLIYQDLTEVDYTASGGASEAASGAPVANAVDYAFIHQLGLSLMSDQERWRRACEFLRMATRGLPALAPAIFTQIAQLHQRQGEGEAAWNYYELAQRAGRAVGAKNLDEENRMAYFGAVKLLAEVANKHNLIETAIENYHLYLEYERSGLDTLRTLADLYERKGDPLAALRFTEEALIYNAKDKDLLERKDRYYYSVMPNDLEARLDWVRGCFDLDYCLRKSRSLLDLKNWNVDTLDWAQHLAELARIVKPNDLLPKVLVARCRLRRGEKEEAVAMLEQVRSPKPEKFATSEDEDAWYLASKLLGELYLYDLHRPDLAVACFKDFRQSSKSGADTIYKLGQAYEQIGDLVRAVKSYKHVVSYDSHPLAPDARDALARLQST